VAVHPIRLTLTRQVFAPSFFSHFGPPVLRSMQERDHLIPLPLGPVKPKLADLEALKMKRKAEVLAAAGYDPDVTLGRARALLC
jgi:hypothetical protein